MAAAVGLGLLLCGCGGGELPDRVGASVIVRSAAVDTPVLRLLADVGGGCNVGGPYTLSTEVDPGDDATIVTITGHDYRSDDGECAELASAEAELDLPTLDRGQRHRLEIRLDERSNTFVVEATAEGIVATEQSGDNVRLSCRDRAEDPSTGCTAPADG